MCWGVGTFFFNFSVVSVKANHQLRVRRRKVILTIDKESIWGPYSIFLNPV
jgi:hypothetical protein